VKCVGISLAMVVAACGSYIPESELPVARDLDCTEKIEIEHDGNRTLASGCGRKKGYRCKVEESTGERFCVARGDESYGVNSETWVKDVR
jgi:hypothetical protein